MTQEEINKKAFEAYPEDCAWVKVDENSTNYTEIDSDGQAWLKVDTNKPYREGYIKALTELNELPKIHGWVARDEDGELHFFGSELGDGAPCYDEEYGTWGNATCNMINISRESGPFGDLKYTDDPVEVELLIRKI